MTFLNIRALLFLFAFSLISQLGRAQSDGPVVADSRKLGSGNALPIHNMLSVAEEANLDNGDTTPSNIRILEGAEFRQIRLEQVGEREEGRQFLLTVNERLYKNLTFTLQDTEGSIIKQGPITTGKAKLDISDSSLSVMTLKVMDARGILKSFRFQGGGDH